MDSKMREIPKNTGQWRPSLIHITRFGELQLPPGGEFRCTSGEPKVACALRVSALNVLNQQTFIIDNLELESVIQELASSLQRAAKEKETTGVPSCEVLTDLILHATVAKLEAAGVWWAQVVVELTPPSHAATISNEVVHPLILAWSNTR